MTIMPSNSPDDEEKLDPRGDVVLLLSFPPNPEKKAEVEASSSTVIVAATVGDAPDASAGEAAEEPLTGFPEEPVEDGAEQDTNSSASHPQSSDNHVPFEHEEEPSLRVRVSSSHLRLASTYFDNMLSSDLAEGKAIRTYGSVEISFQHFEDPETIMILLKIIHGRTRSVPRTVALEQLAEMAVLTDYLGCHEAVEPFADMWTEKLNGRMPSLFSEDVCRWMCVAWVFKKPVLFTAATKVAQSGSCEPLVCDSYPIPEHVLNSINEARTMAISEILSLLQNMIQDYQNAVNIFCSEECDSMTLGALTRRARAEGILPPSKVPYTGISVQKLASWFEKVQLPTAHYCESGEVETSEWDGWGISRKKGSKIARRRVSTARWDKPPIDGLECDHLYWAKAQVAEIEKRLSGLNIEELNNI